MKKILLVICFCLPLFAQDSIPSEPLKPLIVDGPSTEQIYRNSSEFYRLDKKMLFTAQLAGFGPSPGNSSLGLTAGYYLDHNSLVTLDATKSNNPNASFYSQYRISHFSTGLSYKKFVANSFYYKAGFDYRTVEYNYKNFDLFTGLSNREDSFNAESVVASLSIGNQWQWENFTLGCDWIGYSKTIYYDIKNEKSIGGTTTLHPELIDSENELVKMGMHTILRFYLGASF
jgi:hypothetical protein